MTHLGAAGNGFVDDVEGGTTDRLRDSTSTPTSPATSTSPAMAASESGERRWPAVTPAAGRVVVDEDREEPAAAEDLRDDGGIRPEEGGCVTQDCRPKARAWHGV